MEKKAKKKPKTRVPEQLAASDDPATQRYAGALQATFKVTLREIGEIQRTYGVDGTAGPDAFARLLNFSRKLWIILFQAQRSHVDAPETSRDDIDAYVKWLSLTAQKLGIGVRPLDYAKSDLRLRVQSPQEWGRTRAVEKEPWTVDWIERSIRPDSVFYDIGANVGAFSLIAAARSGNKATVVAIEPSYPTAAALLENVALNGMGDCITVLPVVLTDRTALADFHLRSLNAGSALHGVGHDSMVELQKRFDPKLRTQAIGYRLDDLIDQFALPVPQHMKIDVDGHEIALLEGACETLARPELQSIMIECSGSKARQTLEAILVDRCGLRFDGEWWSATSTAPHGVSYRLYRR